MLTTTMVVMVTTAVAIMAAATTAVGNRLNAPPPILGDRVLDLASADREQLPALSDLRHPVAAYLSGLARSSAAPHVLRIGQLSPITTSPPPLTGCWQWPA